MSYEQKIKILASDVDAFQHLRLSVLFRFLQEISIAHTEALGAGRDKTLDKGALWVISRMAVKQERPIEYDEHVVLESWPGETMHFIFPRYYRIRSEDTGETLLQGSGLWSLIWKEDRSIVIPSDLGVEIPGDDRPDQFPMPGALDPPDLTEEFPRVVRFTDIDLNGHVNNTRYMDWLDDLYGATFHEQHFWKEFQVNYTKEIRADDPVVLQRGQEGDTVYVAGMASGEPAFQMRALIG